MAQNDTKSRERIAVGRDIDWENEGLLGTVSFGPSSGDAFPPLPIRTIEELLEAGHLDPYASHNEAPPTVALLEWAKDTQEEYLKHQFEIGFTGYMVSPNRSDTRTRLTGISIQAPEPIPEPLKREAGRAFKPDLLVVDDFEILLTWD